MVLVAAMGCASPPQQGRAVGVLLPLPILSGTAPAPASWPQIKRRFDDGVQAYLSGNYGIAAEAFLSATQPPPQERTAYDDIVYVGRELAYRNAWLSFEAAGRSEEGRQRITAYLGAEEPRMVEDVRRILDGTESYPNDNDPALESTTR